MSKLQLSFAAFVFIFPTLLAAAGKADLSLYLKDEKGVSKTLRGKISDSAFLAKCKVSEVQEIILGESGGRIALLQIRKIDTPTLVLAATLTQTKKDANNIKGVFDEKNDQAELMRWSAIALDLNLKKSSLNIEFRLRIEAQCQSKSDTPLSAYLPGSPTDNKVRWDCKGAAAEDRYVVVDSKKDGPALWKLGGYDPAPRYLEKMDWKNGIFDLSLVETDVTPEVSNIKKPKRAGPTEQRKTEYHMKSGTFVEEQITTLDGIPCSYHQ